MAQRDLSTFNTVLPQVQEQVAPLAAVAADIGSEFVKISQEAKISENLSKASLELNALTNQYMTEYESNPTAGLEAFQKKRTELFDTYGKEINPMYRRAWQDRTREMSGKSDGVLQAWTFKQAKINTVNSVNTSMQNYLQQAQIDGERFAKMENPDLQAMLNYAEAHKNLEQFGSERLGSETTKEMLKNFGGDYVKTFVSSVAQENPLKALRLMDESTVRDSFDDPDQYAKMKEAVEARAVRYQDVIGQRQVLDVLKNENALLTRSLDKPVSYAELQKAFQTNKLGPAAQEYFLKANGFTKSDIEGGAGKVQKLDPAQALEYKLGLYEQVAQLTTPPAEGEEAQPLDTKKVAKLQNDIYVGMLNKSLTDAEGTRLLADLVQPVIVAKEGALQSYGQDAKFFGLVSGYGFSELKKYYDKNLAVIPKGKELSDLERSSDSRNRLALYDIYTQELQKAAVDNGLDMNGLLQLDDDARQDVFNKAMNESLRKYHVRQRPSLATLPDLPNQVFTGGQLIQGALGPRNLKPAATVQSKLKTLKDENGNIYRQLPDGRYELMGTE